MTNQSDFIDKWLNNTLKFMAITPQMIKFLDLQKINAQHAADLKEVAAKVIDSGWYIRGEEVDNFEKMLANYLDVKEVIGVANGLDALRLIFRAYIEMGVMEEGDEIIVPANTFIATILAITDNHLKPVLVEPDLNTYNLDFTKIEPLITKRTRAIVVVHLYGQACWSKELENLATQYHLKIIEDNAQALGAEYFDESVDIVRKTGSLGDAAGLSFYPGKNLGALGDAGAVTTNDEQLAELVRTLGNYGSSQKYVFDYRGLNSRMDELQAAFLSVKLKYLEDENENRRKIARFYIDHLKNPAVILPEVKDWNAHVFHLFVIRCKERDKLQQYLTENEIQTLIHYPIPPHKQNCYKKYNSLSLPITEQIHNEVLTLPISPLMTTEEMSLIVEKINIWK